MFLPENLKAYIDRNYLGKRIGSFVVGSNSQLCYSDDSRHAAHRIVSVLGRREMNRYREIMYEARQRMQFLVRSVLFRYGGEIRLQDDSLSQTR